MSSRLRFVIATVAWLAMAGLAAAQERAATGGDGNTPHARAIEFSPVSPFIRIYAVQYARRISDRDEVLVGGAYTNIKYDFGRSHAPTGIIGLYGDSKPQSFKDKAEQEAVFMSPMFFLGWRFH